MKTEVIKSLQNSGKPEHEIFPVTGMTCAGCASSVETTLQHTDGVLSAAVNFESKTVQVQYSHDTSPEKLHEALAKIGYGLVIGSKHIQAALQDKQEKGNKS